MAARAPLATPRSASSASPRPAAAPLVPTVPAPTLRCLRLRARAEPTWRARLLRPAGAAAKPGAIGTARSSVSPVASGLLQDPAQFHAASLTFGRKFAGSAAEAAPAEGLASKLRGVEVLDLSGKAVPIVDLWKDRKAVVAFARHFGCVLCRKRADLLASKQDVMQAAGVALVLIGPGTVEQAKAFCEQTKFKGEVYADPNHASYDALEFAFGLFSTFTPSAGLKIIQLYREGYRQDWELSFEKNTRTKGGWYQGGLLVAGPGIDNIVYIHKDKEAGDDPDMQDVLRACCS
ncbi:hypothetical protein ACP70R_013939 [Stipagrostis hirtigluma subsp. patula]